MVTDDNIRLLLEMLDHPEAYTEQDIQDIINRDEDTRETYRLMIEAKRSSLHRHNDKPADVDAAWQRFNEHLQGRQHDRGRQHGRGRMKIAAAFIGVLLISGIALAAVHLVRHYAGEDRPAQPQERTISNTQRHVAPDDTVKTVKATATAPADTLHPVVFDNVALGDMLPEIGAHYDAEVTFANDKVRQLRFRFVWNPQQGIDQVVSDLNQFASLTVTFSDHRITVE